MKKAKYSRLPTSEGHDEQDPDKENVQLAVLNSNGTRSLPSSDEELASPIQGPRSTPLRKLLDGGPRSSKRVRTVVVLLSLRILSIVLIVLAALYLVHIRYGRSKTTIKNDSFSWALGEGPLWQSNVSSNLSWNVELVGLSGESTIRLFDVNDDGFLDLVLGVVVIAADRDTPSEEDCAQAGFDFPCTAGVIAVNGRNGSRLWLHPTDEEVFAVVCGRVDVNRDGKADCFVSGRGAEIEALDSHSGRALWNSRAVRGRLNKAWNIYTPAILSDLTGDQVEDLLIVNGGNKSYLPWELCRHGAVSLLLSGRTGQLLGKPVPMPDNKESYMSPVLGKVGGVKQQIDVVFVGTGGETVSGSLWVMSLYNVFAAAKGKPLSRWSWGECKSSTPLEAIKLATGVHRGVAVPPVLVDLTEDGVLDIIVSVFDGQLLAIDGVTCSPLWRRSFKHSEFYSSPAVGRFNNDNIPDVFFQINHGSWWLESYNSSSSLVLDGATGETLWTMESRVPSTNSPLSLLRHPSSPQGDLFVFWSSGKRKWTLTGSKRNACGACLLSPAVKSKNLLPSSCNHTATKTRTKREPSAFESQSNSFRKMAVKHHVGDHGDMVLPTPSDDRGCPAETVQRERAMWAAVRAKVLANDQQKSESRQNDEVINTVQLLLLDAHLGCRLTQLLDFSPKADGFVQEPCSKKFNFHQKQRRHLNGKTQTDQGAPSADSSTSQPATSRCDAMFTPAIGDIDGDGHFEIAYAVSCSIITGRGGKGKAVVRVGVKTLSMAGELHQDGDGNNLCRSLHKASSSDVTSTAWDSNILPPSHQPWLSYLGTCATSTFDRKDHHDQCGSIVNASYT